MVGTSDVPIAPPANIMAAIIIIFLRPYLSAKDPPINAPIIAPINTALTTNPLKNEFVVILVST